MIFDAGAFEELKQAEEALAAHRERLAVMLGSVSDGLIAADTDGKVVLLTQVAEQLTGWTYGQASGRHLSEVLRINDVGNGEPAENPVLKALQSGAGAGREEDSILVSRNGAERIIAGSASPVLDKGGNHLGAVFVFRDVTQRRAESRRLREARQYSERLIQTANVMIIGLDAEGNVRVFNEAAEKVTGYERAELTGRNWFEILAPRDRYPGIWRAFAAGAAGGLLPEVAESPILTKSGEQRLISWRNSVIREGDKITGTISFGLDITEQRQTEDELRKLYQAVEQSPSSVVITDTSGAIEYVNPKFVAITGYTREESIGQNPRVLKSGEIPPEGYKQLWDTITSGREWRGEFHNKRKNGELYWEFGSISPIRDPSGAVTHFVAVKEDITERKQAEEEIKRLHRNLERRAIELDSINKELEAFSYSVSHDLRAPLRSIDGFSQALLEDYDEVLDGQGRDYLRRVRAASQRMEQLIDDLLALSRTTQREMRRNQVDMSGLAAGIAAELQRNEPGRRVEFVIQPGLAVRGDSHLLRIALENLLGNSWKFTGRRSRAKIEFGATHQDGETVYFVRDNGAGFDPAYAGKLFGVFQRLHDSTEFPGTGIGLATVQRIIRRHGGRVWPQSAVDQGATFYFTL